MQKLRVAKSKREVTLMKAAADLSAEAHTKVSRVPGAGHGNPLLTPNKGDEIR